MTDILQAAIAGAALFYLFVVGLLWCMVGFVQFGPIDAWNVEPWPRRRDRIAIRLIYGVPIGLLFALVAIAFGAAWVR